MPLVTAGFGLVTGVALIELATHVTNMSNIAPDLALMIGLGVGIDYSLFIVTRFRESYIALGDIELSVLEAMDTSGRAVLLAGTTVVIALLGMFATGVPFMYGLAIAAVIAVLLTLVAAADAAAGAPLTLRAPAGAPAAARRALPAAIAARRPRNGAVRQRARRAARCGEGGARSSMRTRGRWRSAHWR